MVTIVNNILRYIYVEADKNIKYYFVYEKVFINIFYNFNVF